VLLSVFCEITIAQSFTKVFYEDSHKLYNGFDFLTKEFSSEKEFLQFVEELKLQYPNLQFIKNL